MTANTPASRKAKGRKLQNTVASMIQDTLGLPESDVRPTAMGQSGEDIQLSERAQSIIPFDDVEVKCQEALNIWAALEQSEERGTSPLVVFKRNRSPIYAALLFDDLLQVLATCNELNTQIVLLRSSILQTEPQNHMN